MTRMVSLFPQSKQPENKDPEGLPMSAPDRALIDEIENLMLAAHGPSHIMTITPMVAAYLLETYNTNNRSKKPEKVDEYAKYMKAGNWKLTGDTLKFSDRQKLRDGQNRLLACVKTGCSFQTHLVFGVDDEAFWWMDRGRPRNGGDSLTIQGWGDAEKVSTALRWVALFERDIVKTRRTFIPDEIKEIALSCNHGLVSEAVRVARRVYDVDRSPTGPTAALYYITSKKDRRLSINFFDAWITGRFEGRFRALGKALQSIHKKRLAQSGRLHDVVRAAILVMAWNNAVVNRVGAEKDFEFDVRNDRFPRIEG